MKPNPVYLLIVSLALGTLVVSSAGGSLGSVREPKAARPRAETLRSSRGVDGFATYYSKRHEARRTTSGERYRSDGFTAAHPSAPLGSLMRVVCVATGREVVVRVNDRCRKRRYPIIDLSTAAARELGILKKGKVRVKIFPVASAIEEVQGSESTSQ